ncbi:MAG: hypothetical protein ACREDF_02455 [Thermoplasmata archaeon]
MKVGLLPIGALPPGLLGRLSDRLARFGILGEALEQVSVPKSARTGNSGQRRAEAFVAVASKLAGSVLAVTLEDLRAEEYEFVFGYANIGSPGAVVSLARLRDPQPDRSLDRLVKESVHELGHTWGLAHCDSRRCVMHHSESVEDVDAKEEGFCRKCGGRVLFGIGKL